MCQGRGVTTATETGIPFTARDVQIYVLASWGCIAVVAGLYWLAVFASAGMSPGWAGMYLFFFASTVTIALLVLWVSAPIAWLVGRAMRGVPRIAWQMVAFWAMGTVVATIALWLAAFLFVAARMPAIDLTTVAMGAVFGLCAAIGRLAAFRSRRRRDLVRAATQHAGAS